MIELARALATAPRLLMIDEPAAGLNAAEVERLIERIRLLRARGMTEGCLGVDAENLSGALRLYQACGFRETGRTTLYQKPFA